MAERPDLGTKMECASCGERFFDLNRIPITCPKCAYAYPTDEEKSVPVVETKPTEDATTNAATPAEEDAEFVSLEDADAATISELTGGDDDDSVNPDEDNFLEEDGTSTSIDDVVIPNIGDDDMDS